jgi:uncharacterized protein
VLEDGRAVEERRTSEEQLIRIFADTASLAWKWRKPLSARLQPVKGKGGRSDRVQRPYLFNTTIRALP